MWRMENTWGAALLAFGLAQSISCAPTECSEECQEYIESLERTIVSLQRQLSQGCDWRFGAAAIHEQDHEPGETSVNRTSAHPHRTPQLMNSSSSLVPAVESPVKAEHLRPQTMQRRLMQQEDIATPSAAPAHTPPAADCEGTCKKTTLCYSLGCVGGKMRTDGPFTYCAQAKGRCDTCYKESACGGESVRSTFNGNVSTINFRCQCFNSCLSLCTAGVTWM